MPALDLQRFRRLAGDRAETFARAEPFPHVVLDGFLDPDAATAVAAEFDEPGLGWKSYHHVNERKSVCSDLGRMGPASRALIGELQSPAFTAALESLVGVRGLVSDPELDGAGLQETRPGGFLNVHVDHLAHATRRTWSRQLNLLLYLSPGWQAAYGGCLEFWDREVTRCVRSIEPRFNRCVIFQTSTISFHGVPSGVACPPGEARRSVALYYYRDEVRPCALRPTYYVPLPGDPPLRRTLIRLDRWALAVYSFAKRYTGVSDALVSRLLRYF